ncbi:MAG: cytochrome c, partial [Bacteroidota bacterium]
MSSISLIFKQFSKSVLLLACFTVWGISAKAQGDAAKGEATFKSTGCNGCHKIDARSTGPALGPLVSSDTNDKWLTSWIHDSQALVKSGDAKAKAIFEEYGQTVMPAYPQLSDGDVADILAYVRADWKKIEEAKAKAPAAGAAVVDQGPSSVTVYALIAIVIVAFIIILVLNRVISTLERLLSSKRLLPIEEVLAADGSVVKEEKYVFLRKILKNKKLVFFILL